MQKKKGGVSGFLGSYDKTYLYFAEGDSNTRNITEFIKDYHKFYDDNEFDASDRGFFLVSGNFDKVDFNNLRNGLLKNNDIKNSILVRQVEREVIKQKTEVQQEKIKVQTVEITRTNISTEKVSLISTEKVSLVRNTIEGISFVPSSKEREYETQLFQRLGGIAGLEVEYEKSLGKGARFDLVIGKDEIAIEIKMIHNRTDIDRLIGQIDRYKGNFERLIVLLIDRLGNPSVMKQEIAHIQKQDPEKIVVILKSGT